MGPELVPIVSTLGGSSSLAGSTSAPITAGAVNIWPSISQTPLLTVLVTNQFDGSVIDVTNTCMGVNITYGTDVGNSSATVELTADPHVSNYSLIRIYCSGGSKVPTAYPSSTPNFNGIPLRFTGLYLRTEATLWPHVFSMVCRGMLYMATQYRLPPFLYPGTNTVVPASQLQAVTDNLQAGILLFRDVGSPNPVVNSLLPGPNTDASAVIAILNLVALAATSAGVPGGLVFDPADIKGTTAVFGASVPLEFLWAPYRSAQEIITQFDSVCLGFRTHDKYSGKIARSQIFGFPSGDPDTIFTEGIDIWEGSSASRSVEQLYNASFVEGASIPGSYAGIINAYIAEANPFQNATLPVVDQFSSSWIENSSLAPGIGLSADDVARWRIEERNRELVTGQWITYRDDILFPGRIVTIDAVHTAVSPEHVWMQRVEVRMTADPISFTQTIYGLGGGLPGFGPSPDWVPPTPY